MQRLTSEHSQFTLRCPSVSRRWKPQFLDAIFTMIALAIADLFFTVNKVACGECRLDTLGVLFLQPGEDLENEDETEFGWSVNFFILTCYSLHRSIDATTPSSPPYLTPTPNRQKNPKGRLTLHAQAPPLSPPQPLHWRSLPLPSRPTWA